MCIGVEGTKKGGKSIKSVTAVTIFIYHLNVGQFKIDWGFGNTATRVKQWNAQGGILQVEASTWIVRITLRQFGKCKI
jgi:hypothetical protein